MLALVKTPATRICAKCGEDKPAEHFASGRAKCRKCRQAATRVWYYANADVVRARSRTRAAEFHKTIGGMISQSRASAKKRGIEFSLVPADVFVPEYCPVLGLKLERGIWRVQDASPTIDRLDSSKGYVRGNVAVISHRANSIKSVGNADEHERVAAWIRSMETK